VPQADSTIVLSIDETEAEPKGVFRYHVLVDGKAVATNQTLTEARSRAMRDFSRRYTELFESHRLPQLANEALQSLGGELFAAWLADAWEGVIAALRPGARRRLVIASEVPAVLNLPWELLRLPDGGFVGLSPRFSVRRQPWSGAPRPAGEGPLPPLPLRVLFIACAPRDQAPLDYEREEQALLKALAGAGPRVAFDTCDLGSFDELRDRINEFEPHVVHLTGHGIVHDDGLGYFAFEDERGNTDLRSSVEMREQLFGGISVQCAFIAGCQTGKAPPVAALGGICQGLVGEEVPLAVGFAASIADDTATAFAHTFYRVIAAGQPVDRAILQARQEVRKLCDERGDPSWTLPVLYAATTQAQTFDTDTHRPPAPPPRQAAPQRPLPGMTEGYAASFVGRRRELQRLLPALRDGTYQVVLLTGLGGAGKSTLATRLARRLESDGFEPIAVPSPAESPLNAARLLEICGDAFLAADLRSAHDTLRDGSLAVADRLRYVVRVLNEHSFLLVLDNFEVNLDDHSRRIIDPEVAEFYTHLLTNLTGESRAIITCRYRPADLATLPPTVHEETLGELSEAEFLKFMLRDDAVEGRYRSGELPHDLLLEMHRSLGGTPRFLEQIRTLLRTIGTEELRRELDAVRLPPGQDAGALREARDRYCETIVTARLYGYLSPESKQALRRAAVFHVAVPLAGLAAVSGEPEEAVRRFVREWRDRALAYSEEDRGLGERWLVYGVLRDWLVVGGPEPLTEEERGTAERLAGDYLRGVEHEDREGGLGLSWIECLLEARSHYLSAGACDDARAVTERITGARVRAGLHREVIRLNQELLTCEEHPGPMNWIGRAHSELSEYPSATSWYERALAAAINVPREAATALHGQGTLALRQGDYPAARGWFQRSLAIKREIGDRAGEAATLHQLGTLALRQGDYPAARGWFERSLAIKREIGDRAGEASTLHQLGSLALNQDDYPAARDWFQRSLTIKRELGYRAGEAATLHGLGTLALNQGDYPAAQDWFERSLVIEREIGNRNGEAATFHQLGMLAWEMSRRVEGMRLVAVCLLIDQAIGHGDAKSAFRNLAAMAAELEYTEEQLRTFLEEVAAAYQTDRGEGLLAAAFGNGAPGG